MRPAVLLLLGILLILALAAGVGLMVDLEPGSGSAVISGLAPERMDLNEEPTEAFANALHDCSAAILEGDTRGMTECFAPSMDAILFPGEAGALHEEFRWFHRHGWPLDHGPARHSREELLASLEAFLDHFAEIEDLRLKVKESDASADGRAVEGKLKIWLVGRDPDGRREWVRGAAEVSARQDDSGRWRIDLLHLHDLDSLVAGREMFDEVAAAAGLAATDPPVLGHPTGGLAAYGAATADVDGDGLLDLFSTGHAGSNLYLSNGDGTFRDVAEEVFVKALPTPGAGPLFLDHDNDGDVDLFISTFGDQYLLENRLVPDGRLTFRDVSREARVDRHAVGFSAVAGDVNGDGFPDIYVASYNNYGHVIPDRWEAATNGTPNLLFVNQGDGTFREEAESRGAADTRWGYAAAFADVDGDADLDLYAANDFGGGNSLFINEGGTFIERAGERGVLDQGYAMGASFSDYDNDGDLDLHVTKMSSTAGRRILARLSSSELPSRDRLDELASGNALYQNTGGGVFRNVTSEAGPFAAGWAWGGGFADFDNDGWEDLHTPNGFLSGKSLHDT
jgi:hypothetical protein